MLFSNIVAPLLAVEFNTGINSEFNEGDARDLGLVKSPANGELVGVVGWADDRGLDAGVADEEEIGGGSGIEGVVENQFHLQF